jgi:putative ABC transport system permease protein
MYVVVQERTREIGVRRSIGARQKHIMRQFMTEAFLIVGIGGIVGFAISILLIKLIALIPKIDEYVGRPVLSLKVALITIVILSLVGFLSGFFPARRAARLNVADCLRA